jgi:multidrug resistance efflux pump
VPRLPEPALVTAVLVEDNVPVKKGQILFQFDRRPYEYKVGQIQAQLAESKQNVKVLKADVDFAEQKADRAKVELDYTQYQKAIFDKLAQEQAVRREDVETWLTRVDAAQATRDEALAGLQSASLKYKSEIDGVNTVVANMEAQLLQAQYYLDNTSLTAPEDGRIINLQVRPGMVSGIYRIGGIAALIADADRYVLATFYQENLKYVQPGQPVEVALDLYPGQIFAGRVGTIWRGNGVGQYLPSDEIPRFEQPAPNAPQGQYAVKITLDDPDQSKFPIGAQGSAAIYTGGERGAWAALRKISIRAHSWFNWVYPMNL